MDKVSNCAEGLYKEDKRGVKEKERKRTASGQSDDVENKQNVI